MAPRGDQTREHLLDIAELLYGDNGVANTSMRQIRLAADQGNAAAIQYHFGSKAGLLVALSERHTPRIGEIRDQVTASIPARGRARFRGLVEAMVRPHADYVLIGTSERAWIKILDELLSDPKISIETITGASDEAQIDIATAIYDDILRTVPQPVAAERVWTFTMFAIHLAAMRARVIDDPDSTRPIAAHELFVSNLVDMGIGALTAPLSVSV